MKIKITNVDCGPAQCKITDENDNLVPAVLEVSWTLKHNELPTVVLKMNDAFPCKIEGILDEEKWLLGVIETMKPDARQRVYEQLHRMGCRINR